MEETVSGKFPEFPDIGYPLETALAEAEKFAVLAAGRGVEPGLGRLADGWRPTAGEPLVASDVYGSRRLLMAPFSCDGGAPDHWYAWDIDLCWIAVVVGAGVFASAEDALREWRDAVGPAASGSAPSSCPAGMTAQLLAPCLRTGPLADMLQGNEPRDLIREYYRLQRRARDLTGSTDPAGGSSRFDAGHAPDAFLDWYATRHDDVPAAVAEATATIYEEWGSHEYPDSAVTPPPGPARRPGPRLQRSFTTRMTSRPPRTTKRHSAARSEPSEARSAAARSPPETQEPGVSYSSTAVSRSVTGLASLTYRIRRSARR